MKLSSALSLLLTALVGNLNLVKAEDNLAFASLEGLDQAFVNGFESFREERKLQETSVPSSIPSSVPSSSPSTTPKVTLEDFSYLEIPPNGDTVSDGDEVKFSVRYTPNESSALMSIFLVCFAMKEPAANYEEGVDLYSELIYDDIPGESPDQEFVNVVWPVYDNFFEETDTAQCGYAAFEGIDEDEARERLLSAPKNYVTDLGIRYEYEETYYEYEYFRLTSFRKLKDGTEFCVQPRLRDTTFPYDMITKYCGDFEDNELFYFGDEGQIIAKREHGDGRKMCLTKGGKSNGRLVAKPCPDPVEDTIPTEFLFFRGFNDVITNVDDLGDVRAITFGGKRRNNMIIYLKPINENFPLSQKFRVDFDPSYFD